MDCYRCHPKHVVLFSIAFVLIFIGSLLYIDKSLPISLPGRLSTDNKRSVSRDRVLLVQADGHVAELQSVPPQRLGDGGGGIPVVVVEEHHEVLPHWFSAADKGLVSRTGNLLIHIDGHSDAAPPIFYEGYPKSFYPNNPDELKVMIQRNDAFIMEAAMSGFISHLMWVWPQWDHPNHDTPHDVSDILLGVTDIVYKNLENSHLKMGCLCQPDQHLKPVNCSFLNITSEKMGRENLDPKLCDIKTVIKLEEIREDVALEMVRNGSLFKEIQSKYKGKVLIDIDEDFYGCESAIQPALDDKVTMKQVHLINLYVNKVFRPLTSVMEAAIDHFLTDCIAALIQYKDCSSDSTTCKQSLNDQMTKFFEEITYVSILKGGFRYKKASPRNDFWNSLIKKLKELTSSQLMKFKELGFCFRTTPKAFDFDPDDTDHFRLCHGANTPGSSVVNYHTPTVQETKERTKLLIAFLEMTKKIDEPSLVTVCRSMRDGYTPRTFFKQIEGDVISSVRNVFKTDSIHYDKDLMGGKNGWPGRHTN